MKRMRVSALTVLLLAMGGWMPGCQQQSSPAADEGGFQGPRRTPAYREGAYRPPADHPYRLHQPSWQATDPPR